MDLTTALHTRETQRKAPSLRPARIAAAAPSHSPDVSERKPLRSAAATGVGVEAFYRRALAAVGREMPSDWPNRDEAVMECAHDLTASALAAARADHGAAVIPEERAAFLWLRWRAADWIKSNRRDEAHRVGLPDDDEADDLTALHTAGDQWTGRTYGWALKGASSFTEALDLAPGGSSWTWAFWTLTGEDAGTVADLLGREREAVKRTTGRARDALAMIPRPALADALGMVDEYRPARKVKRGAILGAGERARVESGRPHAATIAGPLGGVYTAPTAPARRGQGVDQDTARGIVKARRAWYTAATAANLTAARNPARATTTATRTTWARGYGWTGPADLYAGKPSDTREHRKPHAPMDRAGWKHNPHTGRLRTVWHGAAASYRHDV